MADIEFDVKPKGNVMAAGQNPAAIASIALVERPKYVAPGAAATGELEWQVEWTFEALRPTDPENPETITLWTYTSGKKIREILAQIFGRPLTEDEAKQISTDKMVAGRIQGYAMVVPYTKNNGQQSVKFSAWIPPKNKPLPQPSDFFRDASAAPAVKTPKPKDGGLPAGQEEFADPFDV